MPNKESKSRYRAPVKTAPQTKKRVKRSGRRGKKKDNSESFRNMIYRIITRK